MTKPNEALRTILPTLPMTRGITPASTSAAMAKKRICRMTIHQNTRPPSKHGASDCEANGGLKDAAFGIWW